MKYITITFLSQTHPLLKGGHPILYCQAHIPFQGDLFMKIRCPLLRAETRFQNVLSKKDTPGCREAPGEREIMGLFSE
jgi:hypothetical protein